MRIKLICILLIFAAAAMGTQLRLPSIIGDNMVLQQDTSVLIWGWGQPYQRVDVKGSWMALSRSARVDGDGRWQLRLRSPRAGGPYRIVVQSGNEFIELNNVLSGEVWLCAGGVNMDMPLSEAEGGESAVEQSDIAELRLFQVPRNISDRPRGNTQGQWQQSSPQVSEDFSALAYMYGQRMQSSLNVPVGIIQASYNDAPAESWIRREALGRDPELVPILDRFRERVLEYAEQIDEYREAMEKWENREDDEDAQEPVRPILRDESSPSSLYNGMIAPIIPYKLRGIVWYHGEANISRGRQYRHLLQVLINNWRSDWNQGPMSFYFVQPTPYDYKDQPESALFELRESQKYVNAEVVNTGMVVTTDIGDVENIVPKNKAEVANRLMRLATVHNYGGGNLVYSGPLIENYEIEDGRIRIMFDHIGQGLASHANRPPTHFKIAGEDKKFYAATAMIERNTVVVSSAYVPEPVAVRFCFENTDEPNLFNRQGFPAVPFRTDNWELASHNKR